MPATAHILRLPLKYDWKLSRNSVSFKENIIINRSQNGVIGLGECAPNIRYGETPQSVLAEVNAFLKEKPDYRIKDISDRDISMAARCGLEMAWLNCEAAVKDQTLSSILQLPEPGWPVEIPYSIPVMPPESLETFCREQDLGRFKLLKIKVDAQAASKVNRLLELYQGQLIIDGNEAFTTASACRAELRQITDLSRILYLEQPMPAHLDDEFKILAASDDVPTLLADESLISAYDLEQMPGIFGAVNVKIQKCGGLLPALNLCHQARGLGLEVMVGCMVETTIGIHAAIALAPLANVCDLDSFLYLNHEPYNLLREEGGCIYPPRLKQ